MQNCNRCHGEKFVVLTLKDFSGTTGDSCGVRHTIACPQCDGKGFITEQDRANYYRTFLGE